MYVDEIRDDSNITNLFKFAHFYQIGRLYQLCRKKLIEHLDIDNFVDTVHLFNHYEIKEGYDELIKFGLISQRLRNLKNYHMNLNMEFSNYITKIKCV